MHLFKKMFIGALATGIGIQLIAVGIQDINTKATDEKAQAPKQVTTDMQIKAVQNQPGIDDVIKAVEAAGLTNVDSIEMDDGQWEVKTQFKNIETKYILSNSVLKQVSREQDDDANPPAELTGIQNVLKTLKAQNMEIKKVEYEGDAWKAEASNVKGIKYDLHLNADGTKVIKSEIDD